MGILDEYFKKAQGQTFYHGSSQSLPIGLVIEPQEDYAQRWGSEIWCQTLEKYKPEGALSRHDAVYMTDNIEGIQDAGGTPWFIYEVRPMGKAERHDVSWIHEIIEDGSMSFEGIAKSYWDGVENEGVWEYLAQGAEVVKMVNVADFLSDEPLSEWTFEDYKQE